MPVFSGSGVEGISITWLEVIQWISLNQRHYMRQIWHSVNPKLKSPQLL